MRPILIIAFIYALLTPAASFAQSIVELNEQGIEAFRDGRFGDAAQKFNEAYAIKPEPPLKKNEALAWFKAEQCDKALVAADEYLALGVDDELSAKEARTVMVRCHIRGATTAVEAGDLASAETSLAQAKAHEPTAEDQQEITRLEGDVQARRQAEEEARQAAIAAAEAERAAKLARQKRKQKQMIGLGIAGAGGAVVLGALVYHVTLATGTAKKFREAAAAGDQAEYDRLGSKLELGTWLVPTLYGVGLATTGAGVYLWWSARGDESAPTPSGSARSPLGLNTLGITVSIPF